MSTYNDLMQADNMTLGIARNNLEVERKKCAKLRAKLAELHIELGKSEREVDRYEDYIESSTHP